MFVFEQQPACPGRRRRTWPWVVGLPVGLIGCLLGLNLVASELLGGSSAARTARDEVLDTEAPQIVRDLEVAGPAPGPAAVAWLADHLRTRGDTVLEASSTPGPPAAGSVEVRMMRSAEGDALGEPAGSATVPICVRFETTWSAGLRTTFHEIDCP